MGINRWEVIPWRTKKRDLISQILTKYESWTRCSSGYWDRDNWGGDTQGLNQLIQWRVLDGDQAKAGREL